MKRVVAIIAAFAVVVILTVAAQAEHRGEKVLQHSGSTSPETLK